MWSSKTKKRDYKITNSMKTHSRRCTTRDVLPRIRKKNFDFFKIKVFAIDAKLASMVRSRKRIPMRQCHRGRRIKGSTFLYVVIPPVYLSTLVLFWFFSFLFASELKNINRATFDSRVRCHHLTHTKVRFTNFTISFI